MITALLSGIIIGFVLAMPPGPISVAVMKSGIDNNERKGIMVGLGAAVMDGIYCVLLMLATSAIIEEISFYFSTFPLAFFIFQVICVVGMMLYGFVNLRIKRTKLHISLPKQYKKSFFDKLNANGPFFIGIGLALANLANPTFIPSLTYITMFVHQYHVVESSVACSLLFSFGFGVGTMIWDYLLLRLIIRFRSQMSPRFVESLHRCAGLTFIGFGTLLGYRVFSLIKWADIIRIIFAV